MTIELAFSAVNLIAVIGYSLKQENRITKLETLVMLMAANSGIKQSLG